MSNYTDIRRGISNVESLERELNLKQLQINRLLNITQAINSNVSAEGLYNMYQSFLSWEIGVKRMALYIKQEEEWHCASHIGIDESLFKMDISAQLPQYTSLKNVENTTHPLIKLFDVVIPVLHKEEAIGYVFIGGFGEEDDMYNKVQFITTITNVVAVAIENKRLFKQQLEQERLKREMELAGNMQQMLIPKKLPQNKYYELAHVYKPHLGVGGDYFDYIEFADGKLYSCIGDISGKGFAAALLMANFQANFHTLINRRTDLDEFVIDLNTSLNRITQGERFITFFISEYDIHTRCLRYINAGHNPPVLVDGGIVKLLTKGCTILGSFDHLPTIEIGAVQVEHEAMLLTYTDGLTDITNAEGDFLDESMVYDFAVRHYQSSPVVFNDNLMEFTKVFIGDGDYPDDFTLLSCKFFPPISQ